MPKHPLSKDFTLVAIGQLISLFGNQILRYALPLYLLNQTGSAALFGTVLAFSSLPMILLFPIGGILADRVNKRNIMVILDFSTATVILLFSLLEGTFDIVPLICVTMILFYGIQGAYQPAVKASVPVLLEESHLMQGNSIVDVINSTSSMAGPVVGGILFSLVGLTPILYVSMSCFVVSAVMELFLRIPHEKQEAGDNLFATGLKDLKESFHFIFREEPVLFKICLIFASISLLQTSLSLIALPVIVTGHLGFAPETANRLYGFSQGVLAAGCIVGGVLAGALAKKLSLQTTPLLLFFCASSTLLGGIALHTLGDPMAIYAVLTLGCGLLTALSTLLQIQVMTYLQLLTPSHLTGKVTACVICVCMCTSPLGQFLYGLIFEHSNSILYLPFYAASLLMFGIGFLSRRIFRGNNAKPIPQQI